MQLNAADFEKRYSEMTDAEPGRLKQHDLNDVARQCYDREIAKRAAPEWKAQQAKTATRIAALKAAVLKQDGAALTGRNLEARARSQELNGVVRGDAVTFSIEYYGIQVELTLSI